MCCEADYRFETRLQNFLLALLSFQRQIMHTKCTYKQFKCCPFKSPTLVKYSQSFTKCFHTGETKVLKTENKVKIITIMGKPNVF